MPAIRAQPGSVRAHTGLEEEFDIRWNAEFRGGMRSAVIDQQDMQRVRACRREVVQEQLKVGSAQGWHPKK